MSLIRLHITVQQLTFPLCLVAASGLRPQVRPPLGDVPAWPLRQIPSALAQCSVDMPSGLTLWPFTDDPRITQEGFILHGSNSEIRAKVYRFLLQREIPSNVAPCVLKHLDWQYENGNPIQIFNFHSLEHLTLQAAPPPAKRRAANHISPQPAFSQVYHSLSSVFSRKNQRVSVGSMHHRQRDLRLGSEEAAPIRRVAPPAPLPEPYPRGNAQSDWNQARDPHTAAHYTEQPAGGQQSCPSMWREGVSCNLHKMH